MLSTNQIAGAIQTTWGGDLDAFVAEIVNTTNLAYMTFLGGTNADIGMSIAIDSQQDAWVTGLTLSTNFPGTNNIFTNNPAFASHDFFNLDNTNFIKRGHAFHSDAFVSEISPDGSTLLLSAYLGGTNDDSGVHITVDNNDNVYITGYTLSGDFPTNVVTVPTNTDYPNNQIAFPNETTEFHLTRKPVTEISGGSIVASTQFGGDSADRGSGIAVDLNGNVYVVGSTASTNFFQTNMVVITNTVDPFTFVTNKHGGHGHS